MIKTNLSQEEAKSKIQKLQFIFLPAAILIGLALYGIFGAKGDAFHPLLNDKNTLYSMLAVGIVIDVFVTIKLIPLLKAREK